MVRKPGDRVAIYLDPITQEKLEGEAILVEHVLGSTGGQYWRVRFVGDEPGETYERWIYPEPKYHGVIRRFPV